MSCIRFAVLTLSLAALAACGERPQTADVSAKKSDTRVYEAGQNAAFRASDWKAGDRAGWEEQMRRRVQNQNEYIRVE